MQGSWYLVSIMVIGSLFNGLMWVPYQAQLAYGWTSLSNGVNIVAAIWVVPLTIVFTSRYGAVGAAWIWLGLNLFYVLCSANIMHMRILKKERWKWYLQDVLLPLSIVLGFASVCFGIYRLVLPFRMGLILCAVSVFWGRLRVIAFCPSALRFEEGSCKLLSEVDYSPFPPRPLKTSIE